MVRFARLARRRARASSGFTLVELAIVVVIVGVLSVLAVVGFRRYRARARMAEATNMSTAIRAAQERYKAETGVYAPVSLTTDDFYPAANPGKFATQWGADCGNCVNAKAWERLTLRPEAPVVFGYSSVAGIGGATVSTTYAGGPRGAQGEVNGSVGSFGSAVKATEPFYLAVAWGDTDGDGVPCIVLSFSHSNQLVVQGEGE